MPRRIQRDDPSLVLGIEKLMVDCGFSHLFAYTPQGIASENPIVTAVFFAHDEVSLKAAAMEVLGLGQPPVPPQ